MCTWCASDFRGTPQRSLRDGCATGGLPGREISRPGKRLRDDDDVGSDTSGGLAVRRRRVALGFPGAPTPTRPPPPRPSRPSHGLLIAGLRKLRKTHENGDSSFPKTVATTVTGWWESDGSPRRRAATAAVSTRDCYCIARAGERASARRLAVARRWLIPWYNRSHFFSQV
jgi:hypothetical protein